MKKIAIIYGSNDTELQKKALELLTEIVLDFTIEYPLCLRAEDASKLSDYTKLYVGTKADNAFIRENSTTELFVEEEYEISASGGNVIIEGFDERGVLYGCADFYNKYISGLEYTFDDASYVENPFEKPFPDFCFRSHPKVKNRGIWTWGHVIYDYKGFFDNMVRLKLNSVVIWNDHAPVNAHDIVEYAHNCGIKVIWGYSWFWGTDCSKIDVDSANDSIDEILEKYENEYMPLGGDGIYFQSFTELDCEYIGGKLIAEAVTDFVNAAANAFFEKYPTLELQFGLHATSVKERLEYIARVDKRVRIVWENCGAFPFAYMPNALEEFDSTMRFTEKISKLRSADDCFGVVTKGLTKLNWGKFEHMAGAAIVGVSSKRVKDNRVRRKKKIWKFLQSYWITNAAFAANAVKLMAELKGGDLYALALIEDGMFEETIMFPAALNAELFWNPESDINKIINEVSLRNYVEFA